MLQYIVMRSSSLYALRHGPLTVYVKPLEGDPDLGGLVRALPPRQPVIWLDSARHHPVTGRWSMVGFDPWLTLVAHGDRMELRTRAATTMKRSHPLQALQEILRRYRADASSQPHTRAIGLMGFLSYDLNRWIERLPVPQPGALPCPDMLWFAMGTVILVDHLEGRSWLLSVVDPHGVPRLARREALERLGQLEAVLPAGSRGNAEGLCEADPEPPTLRATTTQPEFEEMVVLALEYIRAGDIFQANVSQRFTAPWRCRALPLYEALRGINPSPFSCFLSSDEMAVVSCSPERLVRVQGGRVDTRPIAGTRPRGATPLEDAVNSLDLLLSEKERAEHIMLVDLARNDLGRVCTAGSVCVGELMSLEEYSHVLHIVSDVSGLLRRGVEAAEIIRAVFPGGTITGCPKVRSMQILRELEPVPRGLYTGSLGYISFDGTMDLNLAIRTIVVQGGRMSFHVGAGIVADSDPEREYRETLAKAGALMQALRVVGGETRDAGLRAQGCGSGARSLQPESRALSLQRCSVDAVR